MCSDAVRPRGDGLAALLPEGVAVGVLLDFERFDVAELHEEEQHLRNVRPDLEREVLPELVNASFHVAHQREVLVGHAGVRPYLRSNLGDEPLRRPHDQRHGWSAVRQRQEPLHVR